MEIPDIRPLLLNGKVTLSAQGDALLTGDVRLWELTEGYILAGARAVLSPAHTVLTPEQNALLALGTVTAANSRVPVGGTVTLSEIEIQPFGESTFFRLIADYRTKMSALAQSGVDFLFLDEFTNVVDLRAALLAARSPGLAVYATVPVSDELRTPSWDADLLACLMAAEALGAAAFGVSGAGDPAIVKKAIARLYPYSRIPLIARVDAHWQEDLSPRTLTPHEFAAVLEELVCMGADIVCGGSGATPAHIEATAMRLGSYRPNLRTAKKAEGERLASGHKEAYFIPAALTASPTLTCSLDMGEELLDAEAEGYDAIAVSIVCAEDAALFAANAHMATLPVILQSDDETALEAALIQFQGLALVDSRSYIDKAKLAALAEQYGAILY